MGRPVKRRKDYLRDIADLRRLRAALLLDSSLDADGRATVIERLDGVISELVRLTEPIQQSA